MIRYLEYRSALPKNAAKKMSAAVAGQCQWSFKRLMPAQTAIGVATEAKMSGIARKRARGSVSRRGAKKGSANTSATIGLISSNTIKATRNALMTFML